MNRNKSLLSLLAILVGLSSCQKELSDPSLNPKVNYLAKTYTEDLITPSGHQTATYNLLYDSAGRIVSLATLAGDLKFLYNYGSGSYSMDLLENNALSIHEKFLLNSFQLVDSTFQVNNTNDSTSEKYVYNNSRQIIQKNEYSSVGGTSLELSAVFKYNYNGSGNAVQEINLTPVDTNYICTLQFGNNPAVNNMGSAYLPVPSKNLPTTKSFYFPSQGITDVFTCTYAFDSSGRLTQDKETDLFGQILTRTFTY